VSSVRWWRRVVPPLLSAVLLLPASVGIAPSTALAADGEVGDMGDTDSITEPHRGSDGRPIINVDYLRDCPRLGITDCWIEVQWGSRCPEWWCGWTYTGWQRIPSTGAAKGPCLGAGNEDNEWLVNYRVGYQGPRTQIVQWRGEAELALAITGGWVYRLIAEAMFNVSTSTGFAGGTLVETVNAAHDYTNPVQASSTGGLDLHTC
jgi:hypothetical protein